MCWNNITKTYTFTYHFSDGLFRLSLSPHSTRWVRTSSSSSPSCCSSSCSSPSSACRRRGARPSTRSQPASTTPPPGSTWTWTWTWAWAWTSPARSWTTWEGTTTMSTEAPLPCCYGLLPRGRAGRQKKNTPGWARVDKLDWESSSPARYFFLVVLLTQAISIIGSSTWWTGVGN